MATINSEIDINQCKMVKNTEENMRILGEKILEGELVIFPTETVYGIGGNAFDENAISKIYKIKKRPLNNPLIVHCLGYYDAKSLVNISNEDDIVFKNLTEEFWPGPLTIVLKSSNIVAKNITCNTDYIAIRAPKHNCIRTIIQYAQVPIAAPSANLSGKVSSTCIEHVKKYFESYLINIIDDSDYICEIGIESTVIKLENSNLTILREGSICYSDLKNFCDKYENLSLYDKPNLVENISPGQLLSHYCPDKPLYILNLINYPNNYCLSQKEELSKLTENYLKNSILIDFNSICGKYQNKFLGYVDLSRNGDFKEAMFNLYNVFHQLNDLNCDKILIYNFSIISNCYNNTLWDKINRASENKNIYIPINFL